MLFSSSTTKWFMVLSTNVLKEFQILISLSIDAEQISGFHQTLGWVLLRHKSILSTILIGLQDFMLDLINFIISHLVMNEMLYLSFPKKNKKKNFTKVNYERNFLIYIYISLIIFYTSFKYYHWCFTNSMNLDQLMHISYMKPDKDSQ